MSAKMERTGNCFEDCVNEMIRLADKKVILVHGLPIGRSGSAAIAGRYPHAWLELDEWVWEPALKDWFPKAAFYVLGQIEYTKRYNMRETEQMMARKKTSGPWDNKILKRDQHLERLIKRQHK